MPQEKYCTPVVCQLPTVRIWEPKTKVEHILGKASIYFNIPQQKLASKLRAREVCSPRQMIMHILSTETTLTLKEIGALFGGRDHTTVLHSKQKVNDLCYSDAAYRFQYFELLKYIKE